MSKLIFTSDIYDSSPTAAQNRQLTSACHLTNHILYSARREPLVVSRETDLSYDSVQHVVEEPHPTTDNSAVITSKTRVQSRLPSAPLSVTLNRAVITSNTRGQSHLPPAPLSVTLNRAVITSNARGQSHLPPAPRSVTLNRAVITSNARGQSHLPPAPRSSH
ncbi:hypothetical protein RRG08_045281 [Elysia crispata]|uniref:Uncharacterized protein n=1 Tax=Elysia crispata TaxID=231223 RepID=A0AAE1DRE8_9GAST|nr:hypothetical protein RRG08_045281 [Elysia crispata]